MEVRPALVTDAEPSLPAFLAARARKASDIRLVLDVAGGVVVLVSALIWKPAGWLLLASAGGCFAAFGAWGIIDRELGERSAAGATAMLSALRIGRVLAATLGVLAAATLVLVFLALALGRMIS